MATEISVIGAIVVIALFATVYYLGYREDKRQREYLQARVEVLFAPENQNPHLGEPIGACFTFTQQHRAVLGPTHNAPLGQVGRRHDVVLFLKSFVSHKLRSVDYQMPGDKR